MVRKMMRLVVRLLLGCSFVAGVSQWSQRAESQAKLDKTSTGYSSSELLPWLKIKDEARVRVETLYDINFTLGDDTYLLNRLRLELEAVPSPWLESLAERQDARVFLQMFLRLF